MTDDRCETVDIGDLSFIRHDGGDWMLWCGCGDCIPLDEVVHEHCVNCHVTCYPSITDDHA